MKRLLLGALLLGLMLPTGCTNQESSQTTTPTAALGGGTLPGASPTPDVLAFLEQRPLHLPTLAAGAPCPFEHGRQVSPDFGLAIGMGPIYAAGFGMQAVVNYAHDNEDGGWYYIKVLWIGEPSYTGPVLIRGYQLDGTNELRFDQREGDPNPSRQLEFPEGSGGSNPGGWSGWPSHTRVRAPGCYAYQVDGTTFSAVIVFQAVNQP
jgi:hypothetical protein